MAPIDALAVIVIVVIPVVGVLITARLTSVLNRLHSTVARLEATVDRMERGDKVVAGKRATIATNLADSVSRADATEGPAGAAADAALMTGDSPEAIHKRQGSTPLRPPPHPVDPPRPPNHRPFA